MLAIWEGKAEGESIRYHQTQGFRHLLKMSYKSSVDA